MPAPISTRARSERLYVRIPVPQIAAFRFFLEAHENLALFTMLDAERGVLQLRFAPGARAQVSAFLDSLAQEMPVQRFDIHKRRGLPSGSNPA